MMARGAEEETIERPLANIDAEAVLLGVLLEKNSLVDIVSDIIAPEDFFVPVHRRIYETILAKTAQGDAANPATLRPYFADDDGLTELGGLKYLVKITEGAVVGTIGARGFAGQIADMAARRRLVDTLDECKEDARDFEKELADTVDKSDAALVAAVERRESLSNVSIFEATGAALERIDAIQASDGTVGITSGIRQLDELTGGLEPGQVIIVAARPGMGKTAIACSMALGMARQGHGVLITSLEMKAGELGQRMLGDLAFDGVGGVKFKNIVEATVSPGERRTLGERQALIKSWPLNIIDTGTLTLSRLTLGIRRQKRRFAAAGHELKVVMIDYLQLLRPDSKTRSAYEAVSEVSRGLKAIAKDNDVAVVALAQLNRGVEQRDDKRPQLADLRDSGQIEQDADCVVFLYREAYYLEKAGEPKNDDRRADYYTALERARNRIDFICAKRRNGRTGSAHAIYNPEYQAVRSLEGFSHE